MRGIAATRVVSLSLLAASLAGCIPVSHWEQLNREVGRTIADATLVAGPPDRATDLPDGRRAYSWDRPRLVPRGGPRCVHTLYAVSEGRRQSLAAWRVVEIELPGPGCEPVLGPLAGRANGLPWKQRY